MMITSISEPMSVSCSLMVPAAYSSERAHQSALAVVRPGVRRPHAAEVVGLFRQFVTLAICGARLLVRTPAGQCAWAVLGGFSAARALWTPSRSAATKRASVGPLIIGTAAGVEGCTYQFITCTYQLITCTYRFITFATSEIRITRRESHEETDRQISAGAGIAADKRSGRGGLLRVSFRS